MKKLIKIKAFIIQWYKLAAPFWKSKEKYKAGSLLALAMTLNIVNIYMTVRLNTWSRDFFNAIEAKNGDEFFRQLAILVLLASVSMLIFANQKYFSSFLIVLWRKWLSLNYTERWLHSKAYTEKFGKSIDNPDQRIAEDLRMFPNLTCSMIFDFVDSFGSLGAFAVILWELSDKYPLFGLKIPGIMLWLALLFVILGTVLIDKIGHPLIKIEWDKQKTEANYRKNLIHIKTYSDEIATYQGEEHEKKALTNKFINIYDIFIAYIKKQRQLNYFNFAYNQTSGLIPYLLAAPKYFAGAFHMGEMMQTVSAFNGVRVSLSWFIFNYSSLTAWQATMDRLTQFNAWIEEAELNSKKITIKENDTLKLENINITLKNGKKLIENLNLQVQKGEHLAIFGKAGSGKTTLLRAIRQNFPLASGTIYLPKEKTLFLSQKPYIPEGTLEEILAYPEDTKNYAKEEYLKSMQKVFFNALDINSEQKDYDTTLSLGEKQKLALARIFLQKPSLIFLDEALSSIDQQTSENILRNLITENAHATIIAIEHNEQNAKFYHKILYFDQLQTKKI